MPALRTGGPAEGRPGLVYVRPIPYDRSVPGRPHNLTLLALLACAALAAHGCAGDGGRWLLSPRGTTVLAVGDWNDVVASVDGVIGDHEMAVLEGPVQEENTLRYELTSATDEPVELVFTRELSPPTAPRGSAGSEPIRVTARVGHLGDAARERSLIADIRARLGDLAGVDTAPLRGR